jgi:hypothetical protein
MACSGPALDCVWVKSMLGAALDGGGAGGGALVEEKLQPWEPWGHWWRRRGSHEKCQ